MTSVGTCIRFARYAQKICIYAWTRGEKDMQDRMKIYRLVPIARAADSNWKNAIWRGEVVVRAKTAGDARVVASLAELDFIEADPAVSSTGRAMEMASAFRSDKLYNVIEDNSGSFVPNGPREVIGGRMRVERPSSTQL
jgi:hypothetical protein